MLSYTLPIITVIPSTDSFTLIFLFSMGHEFFAKSDQSIGGRYWKALYFEHTDSSFNKRKVKEEYLGFLGPVIRAEVGDTIIVEFKNMVRWCDVCLNCIYMLQITLPKQ